MPATKLLLVDDNPAIFDKMLQLLASDFNVVGCVTRGADVQQEATHLEPDVIVLDLSLEDMNGFQVMEALQEIRCPAKVVFFSLHENSALVRRAFELGAAGYVFKSRMGDLAKALKIVVAGGVYTPLNSDRGKPGIPQ